MVLLICRPVLVQTVEHAIVDLVSDDSDEQPLVKGEREAAPIPERSFTVAKQDIVDLVSDDSNEQPQVKGEIETAPIPKRRFTVSSLDELASIRLAFIQFFPTPPSNMQVQGRYEAINGNSMSAEMVQRLWEQTLKPWSSRWWELYHNFHNVVRKKKLEKSRDRDPTIEEDEVLEWAKSFCEKYGNPEPRSKTLESLWDGLKHR